MAKIDNEDLASTYFYIQKRIDRAKGRIEEYEKDFNNKSFYTCIQERHEEMTTVAFSLEKEVINHVAAIEMASLHIKTLQFKLKYFNRFWSELDSSDKEYYLNRYKRHKETINDRLDNLIFDEVKEIEEAANHCFKQEKVNMCRVNPNKNNEEVISQIDPDKSDEEKLTDFSNMLEVLGV